MTALSLAGPSPAAPDALADLQALEGALDGLTGTGAVAPEAQAAWARLAESEPVVIKPLLEMMERANPIAKNWLRACIDAVAERALAAGTLPVADLRAFLETGGGSPHARRTAFEWLVRADPEAKPRLLAAMLDDPSLDLRYDAVAQLIETADASPDETDKKTKYQTALEAARDPKQLETIAASLKELGEEIDLPGVMGFLSQWQVIGPFDNTQMEHFDTAYPPETAQDFTASYDGKEDKVRWAGVTATGDGGEVDFLESYGKQPESVAYAYTTFTAPAGEAEVRYQSKNATKVWLNGKLIASNEVYHSGGGFDQYRTAVQLKAGENTLLVKVCQNEQRMPWEREWDFRLRVVDKIGTPVGVQEAALVSQR